jgi:hypothetical protein
MITQWLGKSGLSLAMVYRATKHGLNLDAFHRKLDGKRNLIYFVRSKPYGEVFGGFSSIKMTRPFDYYKHYPDPHAFIFSVTKGTKHEQIRKKDCKAVFHFSKEQLIGFGGGNDFYINENSDTINYSNSFFGRTQRPTRYSFTLPKGYEEDSKEAQCYLGGA